VTSIKYPNLHSRCLPYYALLMTPAFCLHIDWNFRNLIVGPNFKVFFLPTEGQTTEIKKAIPTSDLYLFFQISDVAPLSSIPISKFYERKMLSIIGYHWIPILQW
jgi:hypothetical protein